MYLKIPIYKTNVKLIRFIVITKSSSYFAFFLIIFHHLVCSPHRYVLMGILFLLPWRSLLSLFLDEGVKVPTATCLSAPCFPFGSLPNMPGGSSSAPYVHISSCNTVPVLANCELFRQSIDFIRFWLHLGIISKQVCNSALGLHKKSSAEHLPYCYRTSIPIHISPFWSTAFPADSLCCVLDMTILFLISHGVPCEDEHTPHRIRHGSAHV